MRRDAVPAAISFSESAVVDLEEMRTHYAKLDLVDVADRFVDSIIRKVERLSPHPLSGRVVPEFNIDSLREVIIPPFRVIYRVDPGRVRIVRVWRSERLLETFPE